MAEPERKFATAHLSAIEEVNDGREPFRPVRYHFGITAFGITTWTARNAGDRVINEHDESDDRNEELYLVISGRARFELDGEPVDAPPGTFVFARPEVTRTAFAEEPGTTIVAVGGVPGEAYLPMGWEVWAPLMPVYEAGRYEEVVERGREVLANNAPYPAPLYFMAAAESQTGRTADAIEHLRQAIALTDDIRSYAREDSAFDPIRDEAGFADAIGAGDDRSSPAA